MVLSGGFKTISIAVDHHIHDKSFIMDIVVLPYEVLSVVPCVDFEISFISLQLDELLDNPDFRLVHVSELGMSLISPREHKERILKEGYRCISHLWGKTPLEWKDHGIEGVPWRVRLGEDKRDKLRQIFEHYGGYWWMDVFCTDQEVVNKPLSIMGDVYRNCVECVCMLDIKIPKLFQQPCETWSKNFRTLIAHMIDVVECKWSKRVWTFQEWMLPPKVCYTEETVNNEYLYLIDRHDLNKITTGRGIWWIINAIIRIKPATLVTTTFDADRSFEGVITHLMKSGRKCMKPEDYYYGIAGVLEIQLTDGLPFDEVEEQFLSRLERIYDNNRYIIGKSSPEKQVYKQWKMKKGGYGIFIRFLYNYVI